MGIEEKMKDIPERKLELLENILKELKKSNKIRGHQMSKKDVEYTEHLERVLEVRRNKPIVI